MRALESETVVFLLDYDLCAASMFNVTYHLNKDGSCYYEYTVKKNHPIYKKILKQVNAGKKVIIRIGSVRQSDAIEKDLAGQHDRSISRLLAGVADLHEKGGIESKRTGKAIEAYQELVKTLNLDTDKTPDSLQVDFEAARLRDLLEEKKDYFDNSKIKLLIYQIHHAATSMGGQPFIIEFYDDVLEIHQTLSEFFSNHPEYLPVNAKLHFIFVSEEDGKGMDLLELEDFNLAKGTGKLIEHSDDDKNMKILLVNASTQYLHDLLTMSSDKADGGEDRVIRLAKLSWQQQLSELAQARQADIDFFDACYPGLGVFLQGKKVRNWSARLAESHCDEDLQKYLDEYVEKGVFTDEYQLKLFGKQCFESLRSQFGPQSNCALDLWSKISKILEEVVPVATMEVDAGSSAGSEDETVGHEDIEIKFKKVISAIIDALYSNLKLQEPVKEALQDLHFWKTNFPFNRFTSMLGQRNFMALLNQVEWSSCGKLQRCLKFASKAWWSEVARGDDITFSGDEAQFSIWAHKYQTPNYTNFNTKYQQFADHVYLITLLADQSRHVVSVIQGRITTTTHLPVNLQVLPSLYGGACVAGAENNFKRADGDDLQGSILLGNVMYQEGEAEAEKTGSLLACMLRNTEANEPQKNVMLFRSLSDFIKLYKEQSEFVVKGANVNRQETYQLTEQGMFEFMMQYKFKAKFANDSRLVNLVTMQLTAQGTQLLQHACALIHTKKNDPEGSYRQDVLLEIMAQAVRRPASPLRFFRVSSPVEEKTTDIYQHFNSLINIIKTSFENVEEIIEKTLIDDSAIERLTEAGVSLFQKIPPLWSQERSTDIIGAQVFMFGLMGASLVSMVKDEGKCERFLQYIFYENQEGDMHQKADESQERDHSSSSLMGFNLSNLALMASQKKKLLFNQVKENFDLKEAHLYLNAFLAEKKELIGDDQNKCGRFDLFVSREYRVDDTPFDQYLSGCSDSDVRRCCDTCWERFEERESILNTDVTIDALANTSFGPSS